MMNIDRAIEKQAFVLKNYCTTKEDKEDIAAAITALEFYRALHETIAETYKEKDE